MNQPTLKAVMPNHLRRLNQLESDLGGRKKVAEHLFRLAGVLLESESSSKEDIAVLLSFIQIYSKVPHSHF